LAFSFHAMLLQPLLDVWIVLDAAKLRIDDRERLLLHCVRVAQTSEEHVTRFVFGSHLQSSVDEGGQTPEKRSRCGAPHVPCLCTPAGRSTPPGITRLIPLALPR